jgi:hypothetical protein
MTLTLDEKRARLKARLEEKIERRGEHWIWLGAWNDHQAVTSVGSHTATVQRVVWELHDYPTLEGCMLRRTCDEEQCIAPAHHQRYVTARAVHESIDRFLDDAGPSKPYLSSKPAAKVSDADLVERTRLKLKAEREAEAAPLAPAVAAKVEDARKQLRESASPPKPKTCHTCGHPYPEHLPGCTFAPGAVVPVRDWPPAVELPPLSIEPVKLPPDVSIVGPFRSGGIVVFTPWGTFNGELTLREKS